MYRNVELFLISTLQSKSDSTSTIILSPSQSAVARTDTTAAPWPTDGQIPPARTKLNSTSAKPNTRGNERVGRILTSHNGPNSASTARAALRRRAGRRREIAAPQRTPTHLLLYVSSWLDRVMLRLALRATDGCEPRNLTSTAAVALFPPPCAHTLSAVAVARLEMDRSRFGHPTRWVITPLTSVELVRSAENSAVIEVEEDEANHGSHVAVTRRASHNSQASRRDRRKR
jgi:hypothetical protein